MPCCHMWQPALIGVPPAATTPGALSPACAVIAHRLYPSAFNPERSELVDTSRHPLQLIDCLNDARGDSDLEELRRHAQSF